MEPITGTLLKPLYTSKTVMPPCLYYGYQLTSTPFPTLQCDYIFIGSGAPLYNYVFYSPPTPINSSKHVTYIFKLKKLNITIVYVFNLFIRGSKFGLSILTRTCMTTGLPSPFFTRAKGSLTKAPFFTRVQDGAVDS